MNALSARPSPCARSALSQRRAGRPCRPLRAASTPDSAPKDPFAEKTEHKDNLLDRAFIYLFAKKMSDQLGGKMPRKGTLTDYEGFVDISRLIMAGRNSPQQRDAVRGVLMSIMPEGAPAQFRKLFPPTKWSCEFNAWITTVFFKWLVGPSELKEVEIEGPKGEPEVWKSGVQIKKCRYLENSGCTGMCVNMCKLPTQSFFTDDFGLPLTMNPNFEDLSCEMIFGQAPPPIEEDEAYQQPCFVGKCSVPGSDNKDRPCPKIDTERNKK
ncbi:unnamed protein product [Pedinophyceae sp. YPF-701]|nr:unnamed protein product [Pedinophyceae sp. YPF-701]